MRYFSLRFISVNAVQVSGEVFGGDFKEDGSVLVLRQPGSTRFHSKIVIVKYQDPAEVMNYERYRSHSLDRLPAVDIARCRLREQHAVQAAELDAARINVDATEEGQTIFDALSKTLPCRWEHKTIIVLDEVRRIIVNESYVPFRDYFFMEYKRFILITFNH